ncbi:nucleotidyltransferase domain-containing protein [Thermomicrobium sp.]
MRVSWPNLALPELVAQLDQAARALVQELPLRRLALFGSWAQGRATAASDVDVLVIYADPPRADAFAIAWRMLTAAGLPRVEPHVYTESEAAQLAPTLATMTRQAIVVYPPPSDRPSPVADQPVE